MIVYFVCPMTKYLFSTANDKEQGRPADLSEFLRPTPTLTGSPLFEACRCHGRHRPLMKTCQSKALGWTFFLTFFFLKSFGLLLNFFFHQTLKESDDLWGLPNIGIPAVPPNISGRIVEAIFGMFASVDLRHYNGINKHPNGASKVKVTSCYNDTIICILNSEKWTSFLKPYWHCG